MPTVPLTGVGGFFSRQGSIVGEYNRVSGPFYGSSTDLGFQAIWVQFASSDQEAVQNLPATVAAFRQSAQAYQQTLVQDGQVAIVAQVEDYLSVVPATVQQAVTVLAAQMVANGDSIQAPTLSATVTPGGSNLGDTTVAVGTANQYGDPQSMIFGEDIAVTCTTGAAVGSYLATLTAVGEAAVAPSSYLWPAGSGASLAFAVTDPAAAGGIITDGGFAAWGGTGSNTPTFWDIVDGGAGVTVFQAVGGGVRTATSAARLESDGSQATQLAQTVTLTINTVYAVSVQAKVSASDGSGTLVIQLTDGDGNVLTDDAGNSLTYSRNMSAQVTTSYQCFTVFFSTPRQLPATVRLEVGFGVAPSSGKSLYLDLAAVAQGQLLYQGGPYMAAFAGATPTALNDTYTAAVTTTAGVGTFVRGLDRLYGLRSLGVAFPTDASPTVPDSLIVSY